MTDIGFSIFWSKKVPVFQRKKLKKLVFWDDYARKITLTIFPTTSSMIPISPELLSSPPTKTLLSANPN
ncbi:hypothetical protein D5R40_23245 [Okeania hirsuta]|uniref:Uncharacterized protein n=1 Tax=Okeania hirsuta TaxID=1458930 RepID=A0A3N6R3Q1_9CYAN|nr:hypothetical protein D4Z78_10435 [Okeania hirsuta]RQH31346.1 hypothetical protein D5R40_23245 [Okeania hirsuta]